MIVKSGREFIVNNGLINHLGNLKVYLGNKKDMITTDDSLTVTNNDGKIVDNPYRDILNVDSDHIEIIEINPLDITVKIDKYPLESEQLSEISSISFTIKKDGDASECLLSRVTFPARKVNTSTSLSFEYHLYF